MSPIFLICSLLYKSHGKYCGSWKKFFFLPKTLGRPARNYTVRFSLMKQYITFENAKSIREFYSAILKWMISDTEPIVLQEKFSNIPPRGEGKFAIFSMGSHNPKRYWAPHNFFAIAKKIVLKYSDIKILFIGAASEYNAVKDSFPKDHKNIINFYGQTSLENMVGYLKNALFSLSNDTGTAHVSALIGKRTFIVGGCGQFELFIPYPKEYAHVTTFYCDCKYKNCDWYCQFQDRNSNQSYPCVEKIPLEHVWNGIDQYLESINRKNN